MAHSLSQNHRFGLYHSVEAPNQSFSDETELIFSVQSGSLAAFESLLALHSSRLRAFVAMKLPVPHLIDEISHETFVFAYRNITDFEAGTDFGKWLRAIAYNLVRKETLRHHRFSKNQEKLLEHYLMDSAASSEVGVESPLIEFLEDCLASLPAEQRRLLEHKYIRAESSRDMAKAFGQSETWIRTNLCRVRTALRRCIEAKVEGVLNPA
jgi:RNA polymerase sigma-70 factor, ECF subfamily